MIDLNSGKLIKTIPVEREPVAATLNKTGNYLLVVNYLPSGPSNTDKVSTEISVIDTDKLSLAKRITLPDGSTGAQGICISPDGRLAYVTHILTRYKLPTTQLSRGWMNNNALSIIDLEKLELLNTVLLDNVEQGAANPWQPICSDDGLYLCVTHAGSNELSIINPNALKDKLAEAWEYNYGPIQSQKQDKVINDLSLLQGNTLHGGSKLCTSLDECRRLRHNPPKLFRNQ